MKVSVIGAGNVGATCAEYIALNRIASEVVILDIKENFAEKRPLNISQTASRTGLNTSLTARRTNYRKPANSKVVVVTSGIPRKPGMTREELIGINEGIVKTVTENVLKLSPEAIII